MRSEDLIVNPYSTKINQIDKCDECGAEVARRSLVRKIRAYGYGAGANLLPYSYYDSSFWTVDTAVDADKVSMGTFADEFRPKFSDTGASTWTVTEAGGSQTWTGSGTLRSNTAVDISGYTDVFFAVDIGAKQGQDVQSLVVEIGFTDATGSTTWPVTTPKATWTVAGAQRVWFSTPTASLVGPTLTAAYVYADVTISGATSKWWHEWAVLCDAQAMPVFQPYTRGAAINRTSNGYSWSVNQYCPECANEKILKPSQRTTQNPRRVDWVEISEALEDL
jgi:hypothetical protein